MSSHQLHARDDAGDHPPRDLRRLVQDPVDPEAHSHLGLVGLEVDVGCPIVDRLREDRVDELDHRRVVRGLAQLGDLRLALLLLLLERLGDRGLERVHPADERLDVVRRGDGHVAVEPGHHLDVVDGEHVRRVRHREQQRLRVHVADRDRLVAAGGAHREQVRRPHVHLVDVQIDVVEPAALGDRP